MRRDEMRRVELRCGTHRVLISQAAERDAPGLMEKYDELFVAFNDALEGVRADLRAAGKEQSARAGNAEALSNPHQDAPPTPHQDAPPPLVTGLSSSSSPSSTLTASTAAHTMIGTPPRPVGLHQHHAAAHPDAPLWWTM